MKLHPRYNLVARAKNRISTFTLEQMTEHDITPTEMLGILLELAADQQKFLLRYERHGNYDTKANEAGDGYVP